MQQHLRAKPFLLSPPSTIRISIPYLLLLLKIRLLHLYPKNDSHVYLNFCSIFIYVKNIDCRYDYWAEIVNLILHIVEIESIHVCVCACVRVTRKMKQYLWM